MECDFDHCERASLARGTKGLRPRRERREVVDAMDPGERSGLWREAFRRPASSPHACRMALRGPRRSDRKRRTVRSSDCRVPLMQKAMRHRPPPPAQRPSGRQMLVRSGPGLHCKRRKTPARRSWYHLTPCGPRAGVHCGPPSLSADSPVNSSRSMSAKVGWHWKAVM